MELKKNTKVTFVELPGTDLHRYLLTGKKGEEPRELSGVTTMMKRMNLSTGYGAVKKDVLARAAARGTAIHEMLQGYEMKQSVLSKIHFEWDCEDGTHKEEDEDCTKMLSVYSSKVSSGFKPVAVEYLVSDNQSVASMIDFISEVDGTTVDLIDYKSSSTLDKKALSWQLSFYKYLFERQNKGIKVRSLIGVHCHNEKVKAVEVPYKGDDEVEKILVAFRKGEELSEAVAQSAIVSVAEFLPDFPKLAELLETKRKLQDAMDALEERLADGLAELKAKMSREGVKEVAVPGGKYVFTEEHTTQRFDSKRFKADRPEDYERYTTESTTAASVKFYKTK